MEIRWHGRGGHGLVSASNLLAEIVARKGFYSQSIPVFGAERRGAPTRVFTRISDRPIKRRSGIKNPDVIVITDRHLLFIVNPLDGLKDNGYIFINVDKLNSDEKSLLSKYRVVTLNAVEISLKADLKVGGIPLINIPLLGAMLKVLKLASYEDAEAVFKRRWGGDILEKNLKALKYAMEVVSYA